jgi:hypothetical protein
MLKQKVSITRSAKRQIKAKAKKLTNSILNSNRHHVGFYTVSPSMAADILKNRNTNPSSKDSEGNAIEFYTNRNLKTTNKITKTLIKDIKDGNFLPSLISVSSEGILVNGQHRLYAISQAGKTVTMMVETGCDPRAFTVTDIGYKRTDADLFSLDFFQLWNLDKKHHNRAAALGKLFRVFDSLDGSEQGKTVMSKVVTSNPSYNEKRAFMLKNKKAIVNAVSCISKTSINGLPTSQFKRQFITTAFALMFKHNAAKAKSFINKMIAGIKDSKCPSQVARRLVLINGENGMEGRMERIDECRNLISCFDSYVKGKKISKAGLLNKLGA